MEKLTGLPATPPEELATEGQIKILKEHGKFKEGMTKDEASEIISKIFEEQDMLPPPGVHLFKFLSFDTYKDQNGNPKTDRRGYPGLLIRFKCKHPTEKKADGTPVIAKISDIFYYSTLPPDHPDNKDPNKKCESAFKLGNLKRACGWGQEQVPLAEIEKAMFWGLVQEVTFVDKDTGEILTDDKGKDRKRIQLSKYFVYNTSVERNGEPIIPEEDFHTIVKIKSKGSKSSATSGKAAVAESGDAGTDAESPNDVTDF